MWTTFWDMSSGDGRKEEDFNLCFIEADNEEATAVFFARYGHNPRRVSCACCGADYAIDTYATLKQATGFHRHCDAISKQDPETGLHLNDYIESIGGCYLEPDEPTPEGCERLLNDEHYGHTYETLDAFTDPNREGGEGHFNACPVFIYGDDITDEERKTEVPTQGYIYVEDKEEEVSRD